MLNEIKRTRRVSERQFFGFRFAKNLAPNAHALEYTTQRALTSFPTSSLSLYLFLSLFLSLSS